MGNTSQRPAIIEVKIKSHLYPESKKNSMGLTHFALGSKPKPFFPLFNCTQCGRENFDGGLCQKVFCACGLFSSRIGVENSDLANPPDFWQSFDYCNSKRYAEIAELESITIGIFERGIPFEMLQTSAVDFTNFFKEYLQPFFTNKMRCISNKDFFKYNDCHFKVMNCMPEQGFVTRTTKIFCYKMLSDRNIYKIEITPLAPHCLSEELFESLVLPYFSTTRHVHEDQMLNINGLECVISKSEP